MATKARILAIDDQLYFRSFLDGLLSEEGFEVSTAASASTRSRPKRKRAIGYPLCLVGG